MKEITKIFKKLYDTDLFLTLISKVADAVINQLTI